MARVHATKPRLLGLGLMVLGVCASLPYRHPAGFPPGTRKEVAESPWMYGEGVSLQVPGQSTPTNFPTRTLRPWPIEDDSDRATDARAAGSAEAVSPRVAPPALPDQYLPLFPPLPMPGGGPGKETGSRADWSSRREVPVLPSARLRYHTIRDGDTLESLALRYLGDASRAAELLEANRDVLSDPELLPIGAKIVVPRAPVHPEPAVDTKWPAEQRTPLVPLPPIGARSGD